MKTKINLNQPVHRTGKNGSSSSGNGYSSSSNSLQSATTAASRQGVASNHVNKTRMICSGCNKIIENGNAQKGGSKFYHQECFVCSSCNSPLKSDYLQDDEKICCLECFGDIKCGYCGINLVGEHVQVMNKGLHVECYATIAAKKKTYAQAKNKSAPDGRWKS